MFTARNDSSRVISEAWVSICGQTFTMEEIAPGETIKMTYRITADSHFVVRVVFDSGHAIQAEGEYVTNGMGFEHEISISDNSIAFEVVSPK